MIFSTSSVLTLLLKFFYLLIRCINKFCGGFLRSFHIRPRRKSKYKPTYKDALTFNDQQLQGALDLSGMTVNDVKVPRTNIVGIDLTEDWADILQQLSTVQHTRIPVYREDIDQVIGILHLRKALNLAATEKLAKKNLMNCMDEVYFIPDGTPLNTQLLNFKEEKKHMGLIVDEYGDIQGLVTLEDILEEVMGGLVTDLTPSYEHIQRQTDESYLVSGGISVRELNRRLHWELPLRGPNTLSGLIVEYLEIIPESNVSLRLAGYLMEVRKIEENTIKTVQIWPGDRVFHEV